MQINRAAEHSPQQLAMHADVIVQTAALIGDPSLPVAKQAEQALVTLGKKWFSISNMTSAGRPDAVAELVEQRASRVGDWEFGSQSSQTNDLQN